MNILKKIIFLASSAIEASLNIPHGVDPTSPVNGDVWTKTDGVYARINGATVKLAQDTGGAAAGPTEFDVLFAAWS